MARGTLVVMGRILVLVLAGCGTASTSGQDAGVNADLAEAQHDASELDDIASGADIATTVDLAPESRDMAQAQPPDLSSTGDLAPYICPGTGTPGLPMGDVCSSNAACCSGLCDKTNASGAGYQCCQLYGTNCNSSTVCCSVHLGAPVAGVCGASGMCQ